MDLKHINDLRGPFFLAGIDEVGRGPLAGPVVAGCACLKVRSSVFKEEIVGFFGKLLKMGVNDSKKLSATRRSGILKSLGVEIENIIPDKVIDLVTVENLNVSICLSEISHTLIDEINILNATMLAMKNSFLGLGPHDKCDGCVLVDGNKSPFQDNNCLRVFPIIKGDSKSVLIGLASIVAKEYRDLLMERMEKSYPGYGFSKHSGYPTKAHKEALVRLGVSEIHRKSFKGVKELLVEKGN